MRIIYFEKRGNDNKKRLYFGNIKIRASSLVESDKIIQRDKVGATIIEQERRAFMFVVNKKLAGS
jgi:hypothetical protein